jgi:uncharacterized protein
MSWVKPVIVMLCLVVGSTASAAGFNCREASTKLEKKICSSPDLSSADEQMARLYKEALKKSNNRENLVASQKEWLRKRKLAMTESALLDMYQDRILELSPVSTTVGSLKKGCSQFIKRNGFAENDISKCEVSDAGVVGKIADQTFFYTIYCLEPDFSSVDGIAPQEGPPCGPESFFRQKGVSLYVKHDREPLLRLVKERVNQDLGFVTYEKPGIVESPYGKVLHIPGVVSGTGSYNVSNYYIWDEQAKVWMDLDTTSWLKDVEKLAKGGTYLSHGVWPDLKTMTVELSLSREDDPNCCPTGGEVIVALGIKDNAFIIKSFRLIPAK